MIKLEFTKLSDKRYQDIRNRHYVPNKGCHGQQIHFLIRYNNIIVGIISGASAVYGVKARDTFFKIPNNKEIKEKYYLSAIINNVVFRLEYHQKNLATQVLAKWRKITSQLWEDIYGIPIIGFETFVVETDTRKGALYKADNWTYLGYTQGNTKHHDKTGLCVSHKRRKTDKKIIFAKLKKGCCLPPTKAYVSSWRAITSKEKQRAKKLTKIRQNLLGKIF